MIPRLALLCLVFALSLSTIHGSVLVADNTMSRMVEVNAGAPFCALYTDRGVIQRMVLGADPRKVRQMSTNLVLDLEETCKESRNRGKNQAPGGLIYPGTKWCGPGNVADSYDDLGHHASEDACCREHDHCPVTIAPGNCIDGICNHSPITRSHCDCDAKFRRCLQSLNTEVANTLGALFFNVVQVTCFKERRPCSQWQRCYEWMQPEMYCTEPKPDSKRKLNEIESLRLKLKVAKSGVTNLKFFLDLFSVARTSPPLGGKRDASIIGEAEFGTDISSNGYPEAESNRLCSQYKFRPSEKYVPLMPLNINK